MKEFFSSASIAGWDLVIFHKVGVLVREQSKQRPFQLQLHGHQATQRTILRQEEEY